MKQLRFVLIVANSASMAVLLAIPFAKLSGLVEEEVGAATVFGWLLYFFPLFASALALWGIHFERPSLTRQSVIVAMPGSFLIALLSLYTCLMGPPAFMVIGIWATIIFSLNGLVLWKPFKDRLE